MRTKEQLVNQAEVGEHNASVVLVEILADIRDILCSLTNTDK